MRLSSFLILLALGLFVSGQAIDSAYYLFPINPGTQQYLAGTMGEMRGSHFHGGIDIKTGGKEGLPVLATQDGYVSRVQMSAGGYGHAVYITHPDGKTSVYAHLQKFEKGLAKYVSDQQYEKESYEIRLFPDKNQFYYQQGEVVGYSGNTGSSSGPHLHFEIRDKNHRFLNPLEFGFDEIKDDVRPLIKKIAFTTLDQSSRVNGAFGTYAFDVIRTNGQFVVRKPIELKGNIGVEVYHYDNMSGTYNRNGIPELLLQVDGDTVFHQLKESMAFGLNRDILVHMNRPYYYKKRTKLNRLYRIDGNRQDFYIESGNGLFFDDLPKDLKVTLRDNHNNISTLELTVNKRKVVYPEVPSFKDFEIIENTLQFESIDTSAIAYFGQESKTIHPYKFRKERIFYLLDLRDGLPDSIVSGETHIVPHFYAQIPSETDYSFYNSDFDISLTEKTLFDTLYLRFNKSTDTTDQFERFHFRNNKDPLRTNATVTLKPKRKYDSTYQVFTINSVDRLDYIGGKQLPDGNFQFKTRDLKTFTLAKDTESPTIHPISWNRGYLRLKIRDNLSGIKSYRATIDDQFLLMHYDAKRGTLQAHPQNPNTSLRGMFKLVVEDNFGNKTEITRTL